MAKVTATAVLHIVIILVLRLVMMTMYCMMNMLSKYCLSRSA